jgi:excisionase family DNA binding protein
VAYSVTDAAAAAGLSVSLLYELMKTGELAYVKIRARRLITAQALDELMARNVQGGGPEVA